jgi:hypothetical protein
VTVLHVTNGDAAAADLRALGEVLPWRDVLHEGPVRAVDDATFRDERARFLAAAFGADAGEVRADLEARDACLAAVDASTPVVLWFEDDLYDQLQLIEVLSRLAAAGPEIRLAHLPRGPRTHLELRLRAARALTDAEIELARRAWNAVRAPEPAAVEQLWLAGTPGLPDLAPALERLLEEHPATTDGLARSERQVVWSLAAGPLSPHDLFLAATAPEERPFLGDAVLWWRAERLAPLVVRDDVGRFELGPGGSPALDRWVGGVHHAGAPAWLWDPAARRVRPAVG